MPLGAGQIGGSFNRDFLESSIGIEVPLHELPPGDRPDVHIVNPDTPFDISAIPGGLELNPTFVNCQERDNNGDFIMNLGCLTALQG